MNINMTQILTMYFNILVFQVVNDILSTSFKMNLSKYLYYLINKLLIEKQGNCNLNCFEKCKSLTKTIKYTTNSS